MPLNELFAEGRRQLNICNACRYCEGYCAVYPALERRAELSDAELAHLANLCHDCRDCLYACMYATPHEFAVDPPALFDALRRAPGGVGRGRLPRLHASHVLALVLGLASGVAGITFLLVATTAPGGLGSLTASGGAARSPYSVIPYPALVGWSGGVALVAIVLMAVSGLRYWRSIHGSWRDLGRMPSWSRALGYAATLRYQRGGGDECSYPGPEPSAARRRAHALVSYGFATCLASTISAGTLQDGLGRMPPYSWMSVPVILGLLGGSMILAGAPALMVLKHRNRVRSGYPSAHPADMGFLVALCVLAASGLLTLLLRTTAAFGAMFLLHLIAVVTCFAVAPFTSFPHFIYRYLSIVQDNLERDVPSDA